jgi:hypothetical protein
MGLDNYNVVLITSHVKDGNSIYISDLNDMTRQVFSNAIGDDKPPKDQMVILNGCFSFNNPKDADSLSKAFGKADMLFGYVGESDTRWSADCVSEYFSLLGLGLTPRQALLSVNEPELKLDWAVSQLPYVVIPFTTPDLAFAKDTKDLDNFKL